MNALKTLLRGSGEVDVLLLEAEQASARVSGQESGATISVRSFAPGEGPTKVREIADLAGTSHRALRLTLGAGWVATATIDLPMMPRKELALVLTRRAAKLAGVEPSDVQFAARSMGVMTNPDQAIQEQRYLLAACSRARIEPLRKELARRGRRVTCVLPARLARLSYACERLASEASFAELHSAIVIDVEPRAVITSLISGGMLLSQAVLEGDLDSVPTLPLAMLQELKNLDSFHRKLRRGAGVSNVFVIGMPGQRAGHFELTVKAALNGAGVRFEPGLEVSGDAANLRSVLLLAAAHDGPFSLDLRAPIPLGQSERAVLAVGSTIAVIGLTAAVMHGFEGEELRLVSQRTRMQEQALDLGGLDASNRLYEDSVLQLETNVQRLKALSEVGFDPGDMLTRLGACLPQELLPTSFVVNAPELLGEVRISGRVTPDPLQAFRSLEHLRTRLQALPELEQVEVEPDGVLERQVDGKQVGHGFDMHATFVRTTP